MNASGGVSFASGTFSVTKTAKGTYRITHNLNTTSYGFIGSAYNSSNASPAMASMKTCASTYCDICTYYGSGGLQDCEFSFIIFSA